MEMETIA